MENIEKLNLAITLVQRIGCMTNEINKGNNIVFIKNNLEKYEYEIERIGCRDSFTAEEAEDREASARSDRFELIHDIRLYAQECIDHNF